MAATLSTEDIFVCKLRIDSGCDRHGFEFQLNVAAAAAFHEEDLINCFL